jgi:hypothetical protein
VEAAESANALQARAYTYGKNIVFDNGQYSPHTNAGRQILAHELAHVVQQSNNALHSHIQRFEHDTSTLMLDERQRRESGPLPNVIVDSPETVLEDREREELRAHLPGPLVEHVPTEPSVIPGEDLIRRTAATVLAEAWYGQEEHIRWIYIDEENLQHSAAYSARSPGFRRAMVLLGDSRYRDTPVPQSDDQWLIGRGESRRRARSIGEWVDWHRRRYQPRALQVRELIIDMFAHPEQNPFADWRGQVSLDDINRNTTYQRRARQYFWLQRRGDVAETLLTVLLVPSSLGRTQFIFDALRIRDFFQGERLGNPPPITIQHLTSILADHQEQPIEYIRISEPQERHESSR